MAAQTSDRPDPALIRLFQEGRDTEPLREYLTKFHPADLADVLDELDLTQKRAALSVLDVEVAGQVLVEADRDSAEALLEIMDSTRVVEVLENTAPDDAADLLGLLPDEMSEELLERIPEEESEDIETLRQYEPDTAGGIMTTEYISLDQRLTVGEALRQIQEGEETEESPYLYVTSEGLKLEGVLSFRRLVFSTPKTCIQDIMDSRVVSARLDDDRETVAQTVQKYNLLSIPVVDENGNLCGIVTHDDAMDAMADESEEDLFRVAGTAETDPIHGSNLRRAMLRFPWLAITLLGSIGAGAVIRLFGGTISQFIAIAFFIPIITAINGNVSLQSSTVVVRGLATGDVEVGRFLRLILRELAVGVMLGFACAVVATVTAGLFVGSYTFGIIVGLSMFCGVLMAALSGTTIPILCYRLRIDPAITAGPFVTTLNDVTGLLIYLGLATVFGGHFGP